MAGHKASDYFQNGQLKGTLVGMATAWIGSISSLAGVLIGALMAYLIQERNWKREARRQVYGSFVGECSVWLDSIGRVRFAKEGGITSEPHWDRANAERAQVFGLRAQIELLGTGSTPEKAEKLKNILVSFNQEVHLYRPDDRNAPPPDEMTFRDQFDEALNDFISCASRELRVH